MYGLAVSDQTSILPTGTLLTHALCLVPHGRLVNRTIKRSVIRQRYLTIITVSRFVPALML